MSNLIDKDALVAGIERMAFGWMETAHNDAVEAEFELFDDILSFINTLEVKEVDLEKEYKEFVEDDLVYGRLVNNIVGKAIAKHFFELGLKANQKLNK